MSRRRLLLSSYSEDDENDDEPQPNQNNNQIPQNPNPINPIHSPVILSSDEEFIDVSENFTPPSPPYQPTESYESCPVGEFLSRMGLRLKRQWLESCLLGREGFGDVPAKAKLCFEKFLVSDMNFSGAGVLPPNFHSLHLVDLPGPFVLQVDEVVNISCPLKGRYQEVEAGFKRCLKLSMTDGVQRVFGMEYRPIKVLKVLDPAGFKIAVCNVHVRHGLLMLVPEAIEVLGGMVEELDAARQRLVNEVNKPPRGRRSRTVEIPPLASRATLAAWPSNGINVSGNGSNSTNVPGHAISSGSVLNRQTTESASVVGQANNSASGLLRTHGSSNVSGCTDSFPAQDSAPNRAVGQGATLVTHGTNIYQRTPEDSVIATSAESTMANPEVIASDVEVDRSCPLVSMENAVSNENFDIVADGDAQMVDGIEHPLILRGEREIPFTYLASLSTRWAAMNENVSSVQGKIKCFLTGVKGFQYKQRTSYELCVYVDDGSLISEVLIDHDVVQKNIGYTPEEITSALSSSDAKRVSDTKETLRKFQIFLVNFEGTMVVEMNRTSPMPVAVEMNQGCPPSDAWLLMRRLKSLHLAQRLSRPILNSIELST